MHTHVLVPLLLFVFMEDYFAFSDFYSEMYSAKIRAASSTLRAQGRVL